MDEEIQEEPKKGGNGLIIALGVIIVLLLIGIGTLAFLMLSGGAEGEQAGANASVEQYSGIINAQEIPAGFRDFDHPKPSTKPSFFLMEKLVVNFHGEGNARFLAVDLGFKSYYPQIVGEEGAMEHLRPMLKNDIQSLLRKQRFSVLDTPEGPDNLRAKILEITHNILEQNRIYPNLVEGVYFTRFVMQ